MDNLKWHYKMFSDLTVTELYEIMKLSSEVFVVEQNCVYLDADDKDALSHHLFTVQKGYCCCICTFNTARSVI